MWRGSCLVATPDSLHSRLRLLLRLRLGGGVVGSVQVATRRLRLGGGVV